MRARAHATNYVFSPLIFPRLLAPLFNLLFAPNVVEQGAIHGASTVCAKQKNQSLKDHGEHCCKNSRHTDSANDPVVRIYVKVDAKPPSVDTNARLLLA